MHAFDDSVRISEQLEHLYVLDSLIAGDDNTYLTMYVAKLTGEDAVFRLKRRFIKPEIEHSRDRSSYSYLINDGIYEVSYCRYEKQTRNCIERARSLVILYEGRIYRYRYEELDESFILASIFNFWLLIVDYPLACELFFGKGREKHD